MSYAELDTSQLTVKPRANNGIGRVVITFAACAAAICIVLFSALFLAGQVNEYRDAVAYFEQYGLSTEGLTHKEIGDILGISGKAAQKRYERALAELREKED